MKEKKSSLNVRVSMYHTPVVRCEVVVGNKHKKSKMQNALQNFENRDLLQSD